MDNIIKLFYIIDLLQDKGPLTMEEICNLTDMTLKELQDLIVSIQKYRIDQYWKLVFFDKNNIETDDIDTDIKTFKGIDVEVNCDDFDRRFVDILTADQKFRLFDILMENEPSFIKNEADKIIKILSEEFCSRQRCISKRRIIKLYHNIFDVDKELFMDIYNAAEQNYTLDIKMKNGKTVRGISPLRVYYDEDTLSWYLEFCKFKNCRIIRMDNIETSEKSIYMYETANLRNLEFGFGEETIKVRFRIYKNKKAMESAVRFLARKEVLSMQKSEDYIEYEINIRDENLFLRFARNLGPEIVILEPLKLRNKMIERIEKWADIYDDKYL